MNYRAITCSLCGKRIIGKYSFDWAGHNVCSTHMTSVFLCASCGQFCIPNGKDIGMGMKICPHCQKYRIEQKEAMDIVSYIKKIYRNSPIGDISNWHLMMIDAETLYKFTNDKNTRGLAKAHGTDYTIYVYRELSRVAFAQVLAHEMLHVFQYKRHINPPKDLCEGFCNLGSYVILKSINNAEAKAAIENLKNNKDPIYGDGFRKILSYYNQGGWDEALTAIKG